MSTEEYKQRFREYVKEELEYNNRIYVLNESVILPRPEIFADRLRLQMRIRRITGKTLAREAGFQWPTLWNWLKGDRRPNKTNRQRLIEYFGCDEWDL